MGTAGTYRVEQERRMSMTESKNKAVAQLLESQLQNWEQARGNYEALASVLVKECKVGPYTYRIQFNPARMVSSGAKVDAKTISQRKCFLCAANRPAVQQEVPFGTHYSLLINPFPIFPRHLTIPDKKHVDQRIEGRFGEMLQLAEALSDYTIFYNGPRCGASAPDHQHFQAGSRGFMPIETEWKEQGKHMVTRQGAATLWQLDDPVRSTFVLESGKAADAETLFSTVYQSLPVKEGETEPMMNLLALYDTDKWVIFIFPRDKHRPSCYFAEGEAKLLSSPASVDMGGVFITPVEADFHKITAAHIQQILEEVCLPSTEMDKVAQRIRQANEPKVQVGILSAPSIEFAFSTPYQQEGQPVSGKQKAAFADGQIEWNGKRYDELLFAPLSPDTDSFELTDVVIGINFHWERKENQRFQGALKLIVDNGKLTAVNVIHVEDYLTSVISSEMSATASAELLKAHAVISRSWLLAQLRNTNKQTLPAGETAYTATDEEQIRWYDREDHTLFDVCADDHCQRYQGITRASTPQVREAIEATRGETLMSGNTICDARFSKCCGGAFEEFQYCWEDVKHPYLLKQRDWKADMTLPDLTQEDQAEQWIRTTPDAFCNTTDKQILSQVLNNYDQETTDFYRWKVSYTQEELSELIHRRSGIDFGQILDMIPVARGTSARLWKLKIVGTKRTLTIGKELEIRRILSPSHLYSSAFVIDKEEVSSEGIPGRFTLTGAGWGHGVGLCQIGAAVMGEQGYSYQEILLHYYIGATIEKLY